MGTLVSAGNPYAGLLTLQAQGAVQYFDGMNFVVLQQECSIVGGALAGIPPASPVDPTATGNYSTLFSAVFLQPVESVTFDAYCFRTAGYFYSGFDVNGNPFNGSGVIPGIIDGVPPPPPPPNSFVTFTPTIPVGGYLSTFSISNQDPKPMDGSFWVDNIAFAVVPEASTMEMLGLGVSLLLILGRGRTPNRNNR